MESSPFARVAREVLNTLEIPHQAVSCPHGSKNRDKFKQQYSQRLPLHRRLLGLIQIPWLVDPNTGAVVQSTYAIRNYLYREYAAAPTARPPAETVLDYTTKGATKDHLTMSGALGKRE
mmetsp:Transcript_20728/g.44914  ORF Transcript_20728/g.44914 Transcript_20728/m.44914 type:complete len:119 (+) Transcript_20728:108-464(+)